MSGAEERASSRPSAVEMCSGAQGGRRHPVCLE